MDGRLKVRMLIAENIHRTARGERPENMVPDSIEMSGGAASRKVLAVAGLIDRLDPPLSA